jgi:hypothetical protein
LKNSSPPLAWEPRLVGPPPELQALVAAAAIPVGPGPVR